VNIIMHNNSEKNFRLVRFSVSANVELTAQRRDAQNRAHIAHTEQEVESRFQVFLTEAQQSQQFSQHAAAQIELQARREMEVIAHRLETADQQRQEAREIIHRAELHALQMEASEALQASHSTFSAEMQQLQSTIWQEAQLRGQEAQSVPMDADASANDDALINMQNNIAASIHMATETREQVQQNQICAAVQKMHATTYAEASAPPTVPDTAGGDPLPTTPMPSSIPQQRSEASQSSPPGVQEPAKKEVPSAADCGGRPPAEKRSDTKEAERVDAGGWPQARGFRSWKQKFRIEIAGCSTQPDLAFNWICDIEESSATFENLSDSGIFSSLDAKIAAYFKRIVP